MTGCFKVWQRDFKVWTKYCWVSLISNLGEPIFYVLAIGYGLGHYVGEINGVSYLMFLGPAILASSIMNSASFESTFSAYTRMNVQKTFDGILATPVSANEVIAGEILWGATKASLTGLCMLLVLSIFQLVTQPLLALWILPFIFITGFLFASLGMLVTSFAKSYDFFAYYFTLILGPMFFFSGTFFPLEQLPLWLQNLVLGLPLTHSVRAMRSIVLGNVELQVLWDGFWLLGFALVFFALAIRQMRRRLVD